MVKNNISIEINIEKSLINIIIGYLEEDSDRKMLNNRYYVELNFMCQLIRDKTIQIEWSEFMNDKPVDDDNTTCNQDTISFSLVDLAYNIYTLRWKKNILYGDYRNYVKKINHIKYKANILTCHYLEDIFYQRQMLEEIWESCYLNIRSGIWIQRCEKINEIEKGKGVTKGDKKRKRTL
ncbi:3248_t:CDS:2 [Rhizophagus irregularis]|nr:3248_t:CDS:2 [Rhizophagus irregularis]